MVDVLVNGQVVELEQEGITEYKGVSILKYANVTKYSVIFQSGISVTLRGTPDLLQMILLVPQKFKGKIAFLPPLSSSLELDDAFSRHLFLPLLLFLFFPFILYFPTFFSFSYNFLLRFNR